jgi:hypothetical protein
MIPMNQIPLTELSADLLAEMRERVWLYTASVFSVDGSTPHYAGTATCVRQGASEYILTAGHVWRELRGERFALSLEADRLLVPIEKSLVEPTVMAANKFGEWGPDLALIRLPSVVARDLGQVKAFYNIDKRKALMGDRPAYDHGVWAVVGAPEEQSLFGKDEAVLTICLFASVVASAQTRDGFDYVDLSYFHEDRPDLPRSYGGISGGGLWQLPIARSESGDVVWNDHVNLEGVAFYQKAISPFEGVIRCHGRWSVYDRLLPAASGS